MQVHRVPAARPDQRCLPGQPGRRHGGHEPCLRWLSGQQLQRCRLPAAFVLLNFAGAQDELIVLPAQISHLLVNGAAGITVGIATKIPLHNLQEVMAAKRAMINQHQPAPADAAHSRARLPHRCVWRAAAVQVVQC